MFHVFGTCWSRWRINGGVRNGQGEQWVDSSLTTLKALVVEYRTAHSLFKRSWMAPNNLVRQLVVDKKKTPREW